MPGAGSSASRLLGVKPSPDDPKVPVGAPGFRHFAGRIQSVESSPDLQGKQKYVTYDNLIANLAIVGAGVLYHQDLCGKPEWKATPANDTPVAREYADYLMEIMHGMDHPFRSSVRKLSVFRYRGFSLLEWVAFQDTVKKRWGMKELASRPQGTIEAWELDLHGRVLGAIQRNPQSQELKLIKRHRLVYAVEGDLSDSPEGLGRLRMIAESARRLNKYFVQEMIGFETDLSGIPLARAPLSDFERLVGQQKSDGTGVWTMEELQAKLNVLYDFMEHHIRGENTGLVLDSDLVRTETDGNPTSTPKWNIELLSGSNSTQAQVYEAIMREIKLIAIVLGVEGLLIGMVDTGAYSTAEVKSEQLALSVESTLEEVKAVLNRDLVKRIWRLNAWPVDMMPCLDVEPLKKDDVLKKVQVLQGLANAGFPLQPNDRETVNNVREDANLPPLPEEDLAIRQALQGLYEDEPQDPKDPDQPKPPGQEDPKEEEKPAESEREAA